MKKESLLVFGLLLLIIISNTIPVFTQNDIRIQKFTSDDKLISESGSTKEAPDNFLFTQDGINLFNNSKLNLTSHEPIKIDSNDDFNKTASEEGWNGSGSEINPYIINNYKIDAIGSSHGIYIANTTYHFKIKNCRIYNTTNLGKDKGYGIHLFNVTYGVIKNNILEENFKDGINIKNSLQIEIYENIIISNQKNGITYINSSSISADSNSLFKNKDKGINIQESNDLEFTSNKIQNNKLNGVFINNSESIDIKNNQINETKGSGILLQNSNSNFIQNNTIKSNNIGLKSFNSKDDHIINNNISNNERGIILELSQNIEISTNKMKNNHLEILYGPKYSWSTHSIDESNTINGKPILYIKNKNSVDLEKDYSQIILANCSDMDIVEEDLSNIYRLDLGYCDKITLKDNSLKNLNKSIRLISTTNSDIIGNTIIKNDRGIVLFNSNENTIFNNDIRLNDKEGIHILSSYNNIIGNNTIEENKDDGIEVSNSLTNLIKNNLFIKNKKYAIRSNNKSKMNLIYRNSFLWNNGAGIKYNTKHIQAYGNGQNLWNSSSQVGNYWRDWTSPDSNSNGIVDSPYLLDGNNARDYYPLTKSPTPLIPKVQNFDLKFESDKVKLSWNAPSEEGYLGIDEYWVYREDSSGKTYFIGNVSADQSTFNDNSLDEKGNYTYYVRGVNITEDEAEGSLPSKKLSIEYIPEENNDFSIYLITILVGVIGVAVVGVLIYRKIRKEDR